MTTLDDRALATQLGQAREAAAGLRELALAVDVRPADLGEHLGHPAFGAMRALQASTGSDRAAATAVLVELARGDAGTVLACPGAALAGVVVRILGDEAQNERVAAAVADDRTWGYLAVTEPGVGSDATNLQTELRPDGSGGFLLHGAKRYIGNGSRGEVGVVLARTGPGPLALRAALVVGRGPGLDAAPLDMIGLRGARIAEMGFDGVPVAREDLLGEHLSALRRGMWGVQRAFDTVRVQVAAMAVGTALAIGEYVRTSRRAWNAWERDDLDRAHAEAQAVRLLVLDAAAARTDDRSRSRAASTAKLSAVATAHRQAAGLPRLLGRGALLDHPLLEKWRRDCDAFEFMEGTGHIQALTIARGMIRTTAADGRTL